MGSRSCPALATITMFRLPRKPPRTPAAEADAAEDARVSKAMDTDTARSLSASTRVQVYLPHEGNYRQGHPGGPGRPKGSRNRMQADTLAGLQFSWQIPQLF
jgi:hypothetical protein